MHTLFAVLQVFVSRLTGRIRTATKNPEAGMESIQVVIITALGLVIVLAVMAAISGLADEYIARL